MNKKILLGMIACVLLLTVGLLTACDGGHPPADTPAEDTPAPTDATTEELREAIITCKKKFLGNEI